MISFIACGKQQKKTTAPRLKLKLMLTGLLLLQRLVLHLFFIWSLLVVFYSRLHKFWIVHKFTVK